MPPKYVDLYNQCWSSDSCKRPTHFGRNVNGNGFILGTVIILGNNSFLEMEKIRQPIPIIYLLKENGIETEHDNVHIHISTLSLHYKYVPTEEFIQDIRDKTEKKTNLTRN
ncbi:15414_t:CDS:2 [Cetraspora pellucida]|uniref:15414_t:CDS:1 n=1 Tax=Cetraspora pellucida TaxID=1433469 RepID=A0A9N9ERA1_9GLOM|nr:15414_t:CDS:2 [Cetraspora pellucida]